MTTTAYAAALNAASARLQYVNETIRPQLLAAQAAAIAIADQDSLEAAIAWAEVAAKNAAGEQLRADAKKYLDYAEELAGEADL